MRELYHIDNILYAGILDKKTATMDRDRIICKMFIIYIIFCIISFLIIELLITALCVFLAFKTLELPEPPGAGAIHEALLFYLGMFWIIQGYLVSIKFGFVHYEDTNYNAYLIQSAP